jgi:hypothetical protein
MSLPDKRISYSDALKMAQKYLHSPGEVWQKADFLKKQLLQKFEFPQGIVFDGTEFRTTETAFIFNEKSTISLFQSTRVEDSFDTTNTIKGTTLETACLAEEIERLKDILSPPIDSL